jgi:hypothetical protein
MHPLIWFPVSPMKSGQCAPKNDPLALRGSRVLVEFGLKSSRAISGINMKRVG